MGIFKGDRVRFMGIVNASPESFLKSSVRSGRDLRDHVRLMDADGADIIDVGGMSTAPYREGMVPVRTERERVVSALGAVLDCTNLPVSVDTCRAEVADAALSEGATILNDISGLQYDRLMPEVAGRHRPGVVLCAYSAKVSDGSVSGTAKLLRRSVKIAKGAGLDEIAVDPSIGFFRSFGTGVFTRIRGDWFERDVKILKGLAGLRLGYPLLVSVSNKSVVGRLAGEEDPSRRIYGSVSLEAACAARGADIIRTHNVAATRDAVRAVTGLG